VLTFTVRHVGAGPNTMSWSRSVQGTPVRGSVSLQAAGSALAVGASATRTVTVTVPSGTSAGAGSATVRVTGTSAAGSPKDILLTWTVP
jgi:hypothetical protein